MTRSASPYMSTLRRFLAYGCAGWLVEVCFTGAAAAVVDRDAKAEAKTYLWMHPIYGLGGLALEALSSALRKRGVPRPVRALASVPVIYGVEASTGWLLCRALGRCPWDYGSRGFNWRGLVRWDFAPLWYAVAFGFDHALSSHGAAPASRPALKREGAGRAGKARSHPWRTGPARALPMSNVP